MTEGRRSGLLTMNQLAPHGFSTTLGYLSYSALGCHSLAPVANDWLPYNLWKHWLQCCPASRPSNWALTGCLPQVGFQASSALLNFSGPLSAHCVWELEDGVVMVRCRIKWALACLKVVGPCSVHSGLVQPTNHFVTQKKMFPVEEEAMMDSCCEACRKCSAAAESCNQMRKNHIIYAFVTFARCLLAE